MRPQKPGEPAEVIRAKGCPGGGKTHWIFETLAEHVEDGADYDDVYVLTFTNAARAETEERLCDLFDADAMSSADQRRVKRRAKTVHGAACSAAYNAGVINDVGDQVIDESTDAEIYQQFCDRHGLTYARRERNPLKIVQQGREVTHSGNQLFGIYQWLQLTRRSHSVQNMMKAPLQRPTYPDRTKKLLDAWDTFKRDGEANGRGARLFEHADYVDAVIDGYHTPGARLLFIDEFQDLSPQEYLLIKRWRDSGEVDQIYIAGDAAQSIYSFRAAEPYYFKNTPVEREVDLTVSRRCPASIASVAAGVLLDGPGNDDADDGPHIRARLLGGSATRERIETPDELAEHVIDTAGRDEHAPNSDGHSVFLLARTNRQVGKIARALDEAGIPYGVIGNDYADQPWTAPLPALYKALRAIGRGQDIKHSPPLVRETLLDYHAGAPDTAALAEQSVGDVISRLTTAPDKEGKYPLTDRERDRLRHAIAGGVTGDPGRYSERVRIGTIHAAKGLEAPSVYLFDAYSARVKDAYYNDPETAAEEHRLFYVGATRASETLIVATGYENMGTSVFPGFERGLPRDSRVRDAVQDDETDEEGGDKEVVA